jgi:hypothetical protein
MATTAHGGSDDGPGRPAGGWTVDLQQMLESWHHRVEAVQAGHYRIADRLHNLNIRLGLPVVILTSFIGTSLFATVNQNVSGLVKIAGGLISVLAALLASLQTFLRYAERSERHRVAAARYAALRRDMDQIRNTPLVDRPPAQQYLAGVRERLDTLGRQSPEIGEREWEAVRQRFHLDEPPQPRRGQRRRTAPRGTGAPGDDA